MYEDKVTRTLNRTFFLTPMQRQMTVGTDCSGMDTPIQALRNLGLPYRHVFSSDVDETCRKFIRENHNPETLYEDISSRDIQKVAPVDVYIAGFPCQPFSIAGKKRGFSDPGGRGTVVYHILDYIECHLPKKIILENVKGFATLRNGFYVKHITKVLKSIRMPGGDPGPAYDVHTAILNTKDHGIPQHRSRWYCVGILRSAVREDPPFSFPTPMSPMSLNDILEPQLGHVARQPSTADSNDNGTNRQGISV